MNDADHDDDDCTTLRCRDCGIRDEENGVRVCDNWEMVDGVALCCNCLSERMSGCRVPSDWQFDGE